MNGDIPIGIENEHSSHHDKEERKISDHLPLFKCLRLAQVSSTESQPHAANC